MQKNLTHKFELGGRVIECVYIMDTNTLEVKAEGTDCSMAQQVTMPSNLEDPIRKVFLGVWMEREAAKMIVMHAFRIYS